MFQNPVKNQSAMIGPESVEVREDEEQHVKLTEMLELLVAAGYFLARVKGIEPFDKVVGGMVWCIGACHYNVDVELHFQENSTIGQKIALTEKIVEVLPRMGCPHRIEPHQIQGLDCIHIFPVIQWLVRQSVVTRDLERQQLRNHALKEFNLRFRPEQNAAKTLECMRDLAERYRPHRILRPTHELQTCDEVQQVANTLIEYGLGADNVGLDKPVTENEFQQTKHSEQVMPSRALKDIVNSQSSVIAAVSEQFASVDFEDNRTQIMMRQRESLLEEKAQLQREVEGLLEEKLRVKDAKKALREGVENIDIDSKQHRKLASLIEMEENLRIQEQQFREHCKEELERLQNLVKEASDVRLTDSESADSLCEAEQSRVTNLRLLIARRNRAVAQLQRKLDETPGRAELSQYQKRFLELYNLVSQKHAETKQLYMMYNTLDDTRVYLVKELNLLNSVLDTYGQAMSNSLDKTLFIQQFEGIVAAVKKNKTKVEEKRDAEERTKEALTQQLHEYLALHRHYYALVKQLKAEVYNNDVLLAQLKDLS